LRPGILGAGLATRDAVRDGEQSEERRLIQLARIGDAVGQSRQPGPAVRVTLGSCGFVHNLPELTVVALGLPARCGARLARGRADSSDGSSIAALDRG